MLNGDYIAYAMIAVGIFTFYMAMMHLMRSDRVQSRVRNVADPSYIAEETEAGAPPAFIQFCEKILAKLHIDTASQKDLALQLTRAGINSPFGVTYFLFFKWIIQPLLMLLGAFLFLTTIANGGEVSSVLMRLLLSLILVIAGLNGAKLYVSNCKTKRQQVLLNSFPEMLDLLLVCIESGLGLDAALNRVCKELRSMHPDVISEIDRTRLELTMLNDRVIALQNLAERTEIVPFRTLVSSLIQTEKFGTSLIDTLRVLSEEQRLSRLFAAEQKAARIPVLITIPLILFIMPAFIMIIIGPPIIKVINQGGIFGNAIPTNR